MQEEACGGAGRRWRSWGVGGELGELADCPARRSLVPDELAAWLPQEMQEEVLLARGWGGDKFWSGGSGKGATASPVLFLR
jgi:hypothetical protein